jgi:hypothetical protein
MIQKDLMILAQAATSLAEPSRVVWFEAVCLLVWSALLASPTWRSRSWRYWFTAAALGAVFSLSTPIETHIDPRHEPFRTYVVPILKQLKCAQLARAVGVTERFIKALRNGYRQPSPVVRAALDAQCLRAFQIYPTL